MIKWNLKALAISTLKDHPKNPRQIHKDQVERLSALMEKFGMIDKPIINADYTIIGGHQRIRILKKKKEKYIECWVAEEQLSDEEVDELCIGLNLHQGAWDFDILANQWDVVDLLKYGFTEEQLLGLTKEEEDFDPSDDENQTNDVGSDDDAFTKIGDIYDLGNHRLICGDSCDPSIVSNLLGQEKPILMVTDPPYGVEYDASWKEKKGKKIGKWSVSNVKWSKGVVKNDDRADWAEAYRLFPGKVCYVWHADKMSCIVEKNLQDCDFVVVNQIIWVKQLGFGRGDYHPYHEPCWYCVKKGSNHNWQGDRKQRTVWEIQNRSACGDTSNIEEATGHSTQKPLECMARPIRNNTAEGEGVYDPFLGSGTTLIAAEKLNRRCFGIELSAAYCDVIVKRFYKFIKKKGEEPKILKNGEPIDMSIYFVQDKENNIEHMAC